MDDFQKFLNRAYRFLSLRPRSEKEVKDYLIKKKADESTIKKVLDKLKEHKFLNDEEFTKFWIEQRSKVKPRGVKLIKYELKQKGIGKDLIDEVLNNQLDSTVTDFDMALGLAKRRIERLKNLDRQKAYERLGRFLASKGFDYDVIKQVIDQVLPK